MIQKLNNLKHTAIDLFELNNIDLCIDMIEKNQIEKLKKEIEHEINNYQHYSNYLFFTELKKAIQ